VSIFKLAEVTVMYKLILCCFYYGWFRIKISKLKVLKAIRKKRVLREER